MSANNTLIIDGLTFPQIRESLVTYLKNQTIFKDYNFEGSNMSVLLDILAYNTQQQAFYLNMVSREMFLDSAQIRDSVVSHAKELNYIPRSRTSASAKISLKITPEDTPSFITMPKGTVFSSINQGGSFNFVTDKNYIAYERDQYVINDVEIFEGTLVNEGFTFNAQDVDQKFVLSNPNIDTSSISVFVSDNNKTLQYTRMHSLYDFNSDSLLYFVNTDFDNKYRIEFGDNNIGKPPEHGQKIIVNYRVCSGANANFAKNFSLLNSIQNYSNVAILSETSASGGSERETINSIKFNAPRFFESRERAVTEKDYANILKIKFPEIENIYAYGGELNDPPKYGSVIISVDIKNGDGVSEERKKTYTDFITKRSPLTVSPIFINPDFIWAKPSIKLYIDQNKNEQTENFYINKALEIVKEYNEKITGFNSFYRTSNLQTLLSNSSANILSSEIDNEVYKTVNVSNSKNSYIINFNNKIQPNTFYSSSFLYNNSNVYLQDNGLGIIQILTNNNNTVNIIKNNIGTIDYNNGKITILPIVVESGNNILKFNAKTVNSDISSQKNDILKIDETNIKVEIILQNV